MRYAALCLLACTQTATQSADISETGELQTKVTYDADANVVLVSFAEELTQGQTLHLEVRRGDLRDPKWKLKDCAAVSEQPIATFQAGEAHGQRTAYRVPLLDRALLQSAYRDEDLPMGQSWADGVMTPEKEAILARGIDTFVDLCVTQDGAVLRREQADFFRAWDNQNPHLVRDAMALAASGADAWDHQQPRVSSPQTHGELCVAALGEIPFFKNKRQVSSDPVTGRPQYAYDTWNCLDSVHIPMTVTDDQGVTTGPALDRDSGSGAVMCDKRQYIYDLCEQGPRVISAKNEQGTHWVLLCRKGVGQAPELKQVGVDAQGEPIMENTVAREQLSTRFDDIAMVGYNPSNGRTCFFQNALDMRNDGANVPHPADIEKSQNLWQGVQGESNSINCVRCHDSGDAFVLTPWIMGARRNDAYAKAHELMGSEGKNGWAFDTGADGTPVVPMMGVHADRAMSDPAAPYTLVNYLGQGWGHPKKLTGAKVRACTSCHVLGAGATLRTWALRSVGMDEQYEQMVTNAYKTDWKRSHFMPFDPSAGAPERLPPEAEWEASEYATAVAHLRLCAGDPANAECEFVDTPRMRGGGSTPDRQECWSPIPDDCDY